MTRADYHERREARIARYEERAAKAQAEGNAAHKRSHDMMDAIPFGQPILVGHYSEGRDRRYRERAWNLLGKAVQGWDKADHYADKAAAAEANTAIFDDDPDALAKLDARIAELEALRVAYVAENAAHRKAHGAELRAMTPYQRSISVPHPAYSLQNLGGNIARLKARRERLQKMAAIVDAGRGVQEKTIGDVRIVQDFDDNRTRIYFPDKPADAIRTLLKARGFRWAPSAGAWQRHASNAALYWAEEIAKAAQ